ncbi:uncharacterized protein LOC113855057 isoform X2 [Abrus precatorius]|uniref:Uncharacterized protein LOC113855057 isoform X2 n=1 Tax=Abrus precatorius TaxID=3816 RepID=A0A8B8KHA5_ABRPR|nr:uncharacterized protein LOC113855057 isoform X2 [Abrus precatorius]
MEMSSIHVSWVSSFCLCLPNSSRFEASKISSQFKPLNATPVKGTKHYLVKFPRERTRTRATLDDVERDQLSSTPLLVEDEKEVEKSVKVLKNAAKTRKVAAEEVLSALSVIEKAKVDPSGFFETLGGKESPGRTWMLIFTAEKQLKGGRYFPLTAVQRFDAAISLGKKEDKEPSTKDPFFIWFYVDEEIAVARGRSGGTAFWCRCHRVSN